MFVSWHVLQSGTCHEVDIEMSTLANLERDVQVVLDIKVLKETSALLSRDDDIEGSNGLEGREDSDCEECDLVKHGDL